MTQAITIFHRKGYDPRWLGDLLESLDTHYPILITNHTGWQIQALARTFQKTDFDEIFFLNETMIVKDNSVWEYIFEQSKGKTVVCDEKMQMFLNKYLRFYIEKTKFPFVNSRLEDVILGEDKWHRQYETFNQINKIELDPIGDVNHFTGYEEKYGRANKILENQWFKKWKHQWNVNMIMD